MATSTITLSSFSATCTFDAGSPLTTTNEVSGTFNFTRVSFNRPHDGKGEFTADFESDGAVALNGWDATEATSITDIAGWGGGLTAAGFNADFDAWSMEIGMDTVVYSTFSNQWKRSKLLTAQARGSCSGVLQTGATSPVPSA